MTKKLDISWFDLKNYENLSTLNLFGWHKQFFIRKQVYFELSSYEHWKDLNAKEFSSQESLKEWLKTHNKSAFRWIEQIKSTPVIESYDDREHPESHSKYPFNTFSVESTPAILLWHDRDDNRVSDIWECFESDDLLDITSEQLTLINTPIDLLYKERGIDTQEITNLTINLTASDEQIINDFCYWLTEYRKVTGYESNKKNFTDRNLAEWVQWRLLPYIDLMLVAAIEGIKITQVNAALLIFDDEDNGVDIVDRLRRTTKPKAEWILRDETIDAIYAQLYASASKN